MPEFIITLSSTVQKGPIFTSSAILADGEIKAVGEKNEHLMILIF